MDDPVEGQVYSVVIGNVRKGEQRTRLVTAKLAMDGAMVEFHDAATGGLAGSAGINWWREPGHALEVPSEYVPMVPDPAKWR